MTISGVTSGSSISVLTEPLPRPRQRCRPSASATPSGVATATQITASSSVCPSASRSAGSWSTLPVSPVNQRNENPCQVVRERPSLKANAIGEQHREHRPEDVAAGDQREEARPAPGIAQPAHVVWALVPARRVVRR